MPRILIGPIPSVRGWSEGATAWVGTLLLVGAGIVVVLSRIGVFRLSVPRRGPALVAAASAVGFVLVLLRWLSLSRHSGLGVDVGPMSGVHIALIAGAVEFAAAAVKLGLVAELLPGRMFQGRRALGDIPAHSGQLSTNVA